MDRIRAIGKSEIADQKKTRTRHPKRTAMPMGSVSKTVAPHLAEVRSHSQRDRTRNSLLLGAGCGRSLSSLMSPAAMVALHFIKLFLLIGGQQCANLIVRRLVNVHHL